MTNLDQVLRDRGLFDVAQVAGWKSHPHNGRDGWAYAVHNARNEPFLQRRWKAADGAAPKYLWLNHKPEGANYYFMPDFLSSIEAHYGTAFLAGGEPDLLVYNAAGKTNSFCWLDGEGSPPRDLARHLAAMNVTLLFYAPDRDLAGMRSAYKVHQMLDGSPVDLILFKLPAEMGSKYDINDLWLASGQDARVFDARLMACEALDMVELYLYSQQTGDKAQTAQATVETAVKEWREAWVQTVIAALGTPVTMEAGRGRWRCPLPGHDDRSPSFRVSDDQVRGFPWPMCSCGIQENKDAWEQIAGAVGSISWDEFRAERAADAGYKRKDGHRQTYAPDASAQIPEAITAPRWINGDDGLKTLRQVLAKQEKPDIDPILFPLNVLHQFGGFAKWARRKKLMCISGISGGFKTQLARVMAANMMRTGQHVIWWGPEWDVYEYAEQDLQRADGMKLDRLDEFYVLEALRHSGMTTEQISATYNMRVFSETELKRSVAIIDDLLKMPGKIWYLPDVKPHSEIMQDAADLAAALRKEGKSIGAFVFDYIQLAQRGGDRDWAWAEQVTNDVKSLAITSNLFGIVNTQVRKKDSERVRDGEKLSQGSAQGLSDAQFNLYVTLSPDFDPTGKMLAAASLNVVKNSRGRTGGVKIPLDFAHWTVVDKELEKMKDIINQVPLDVEAAR